MLAGDAFLVSRVVRKSPWAFDHPRVWQWYALEVRSLLLSILTED